MTTCLMKPDPSARETDPSRKIDAFLATLGAAREGDAGALEALFTRFYPRVQRMVHAQLARDLRTSRPWLAARFSTGDIVQEVFRAALKDLAAFGGDNEGAFAGYLSILVRNRIVDAVRFHEAAARDGRQSSEALEHVEPPVDASDQPVDALVTVEELKRLRSALASLPPREQLLVRARVEGTATFAELAEQLGYGSQTSARRAFYAAQARLVVLMEGEE